MPDIHGRPTVAEVSLAALRHNCRRVRELIGPGVAVLAVVKADAYGRIWLRRGAPGLEVGRGSRVESQRRISGIRLINFPALSFYARTDWPEPERQCE